ncbi:MAG TPA: hypothetical protein VGF77_08320 [Allosphingosinicella sp.]|jgi:hypothetical protein
MSYRSSPSFAVGGADVRPVPGPSFTLPPNRRPDDFASGQLRWIRVALFREATGERQ